MSSAGKYHAMMGQKLDNYFQNLVKPFHGLFPVEYGAPFESRRNNAILTFALQRSGQHLVIDWLCRGMHDICHINHCRPYMTVSGLKLLPMTGRRVMYAKGQIDDSGIRTRAGYAREMIREETPRTLLFSMEDVALGSPGLSKLMKENLHEKVIFILRDPANWLSSSIKHSRHSRRNLKKNLCTYKGYLKAIINDRGERYEHIVFDRFIEDSNYRRELAKQLKLSSFDAAEVAMTNTPDFGGGSSFSSTNTAIEVSERYKQYQGDPAFDALLNDKELVMLTETVFRYRPPYWRNRT